MNTKTPQTEALSELDNARVAEIEARIRVTRAVAAAVKAGASWAVIGEALGISKQTAHARYGKDSATPKPSKISDADVAGTSETPSIFSDADAPATAKAEAIHGKRTVEVFKEFAANQPKRNAAQRQHGRIIEEPYEGMARPGTGKGPQVCKGCGCNNHHGTERGQVYWNDGCKPTKYDTAEETEFLNLVYKEGNK